MKDLLLRPNWYFALFSLRLPANYETNFFELLIQKFRIWFSIALGTIYLDIRLSIFTRIWNLEYAAKLIYFFTLSFSKIKFWKFLRYTLASSLNINLIKIFLHFFNDSGMLGASGKFINVNDEVCCRPLIRFKLIISKKLFTFLWEYLQS